MPPGFFMRHAIVSGAIKLSQKCRKLGKLRSRSHSGTFVVLLPTSLLERFAAPDGAPRWPRLLETFLLTLLAVQLARLFWLALPAEPVGDAPPVNAGNAAALPAFDLFNRADVVATAAIDSSGYSLRGVRRDASGGSAILSDSAGRQQSHAEGETIAPGILLAKVGPGYVLLGVAGGLQRLDLPTAATAPSAGAGSMPGALPRAAPPAAAGINPATLLAQAGLSSNDAGGWTLNPRGDGGQLQALGLQAGDVIEQVNGQALTPERVAALADELPGGEPVSVTFRRDGQRRTVTLPAGPK